MTCKNFHSRIKTIDSAGKGVAVFSTLNVRDRDGDVTLPGAIGEQTAKLVGAHDWSAPNIGVVKTHEEGNEVIGEFEIFMDMASAKEWYSALKGNYDAGIKQEWSYGFDVIDSSAGEMEGQPVNFLKRLDVFEVSPVMLGAGVNTRTLSMKSGGQTLADEFDSVRRALAGFENRVKSLADLRKQEGREMSQTNVERLKRLSADLDGIKGRIDALLAAPDGSTVDADGLLAALAVQELRYREHLRE